MDRPQFETWIRHLDFGIWDLHFCSGKLGFEGEEETKGRVERRRRRRAAQHQREIQDFVCNRCLHRRRAVYYGSGASLHSLPAAKNFTFLSIFCCHNQSGRGLEFPNKQELGDFSAFVCIRYLDRHPDVITDQVHLFPLFLLPKKKIEHFFCCHNRSGHVLELRAGSGIFKLQ